MKREQAMVLSENVLEVAREIKNLTQYYGTDKPMKDVIEEQQKLELNDTFKSIVDNFLLIRGMK